MSCYSRVFDVSTKFGTGGHEYSKVFDTDFSLFNCSTLWSEVDGFIFCSTISHEFKFVTAVVHVVLSAKPYK